MPLKEQIDKILEHIFHKNETLDKCEELLSSGDIAAVIEIFNSDKAFKAYFLTLMKVSDFGVDSRSKDLAIVSHMLGVDVLRMIIHSYFVFLKSPKQWGIFKISTLELVEFNARFLSDWNKLLNYLKLKNHRNLTIASYMLINIILCELVFSSYKYSFGEIVTLTDVSYDKIFRQYQEGGFFETACQAADWDMNKLTMRDKEIVEYIKILLYYEFSRPEFYRFGFHKISDVSVQASVETAIVIKKALLNEDNV
ncbi:MAG: hypothetical protein LUC34_05695 [Campylobacter sp.]|nr:hypothetical protein [Campylobacter sp.]